MRRRVLWSVAAWVVGLIGVRWFLVPPERCDDPTRDEVEAAAVAAADWAVRGLDDEGRFVYAHRIDAADPEGGYNYVRHAGMVNALFQMVDRGHDRYLDPAERSMSWLRDRTRPTAPDAAAVVDGAGRAKLGTVGLALTSLLYRRDATGLTDADHEILAYANFLVDQQEASGALLNLWDSETGEPVPGVYGRFSEGEAFWALAMTDRRFPDEGFRPAVLAAADHLADVRDEIDDQFLRNPDHWAAYGFAEMARPGGPGLAENHVEYQRVQSGDFGVMARIAAQQTGEGLMLVSRGPLPLGAGVGAMGEGLVNLWALSTLDDRMADRTDDLAERTLCTADLLVQRQVGASEAAATPRPDLTEGAWFTGGRTQVDDQQHTLSMLLLSLEIFDREAPS